MKPQIGSSRPFRNLHRYLQLPPSDPIAVGSTMYTEQLRIEEQRAINQAILSGEASLHDQYFPIEDLEARLRQSSMGLGMEGWEDGFDTILWDDNYGGIID